MKLNNEQKGKKDSSKLDEKYRIHTQKQIAILLTP
jgi:hypothetical protein